MSENVFEFIVKNLFEMISLNFLVNLFTSIVWNSKYSKFQNLILYILEKTSL